MEGQVADGFYVYNKVKGGTCGQEKKFKFINQKLMESVNFNMFIAVVYKSKFG